MPNTAKTGSRGSVAAVADVAVVGGGVVGCAVARKLTLEGFRVVLLERGTDILSGASKANSALLHTGFDAPPGSLEAKLMQRGRAEFLAIRDALNLPILETDAMVVAWTEDELKRLEGVDAQARENGVCGVAHLSRTETLAREPNLASGVLGALLVPGEHVIDAWSSPLAYLTQALANGACVLFSADVRAGEFDGTRWSLQTGRGEVQAGYVVNCAGLYGDQLEALLLGDASFSIRPRKGQFVVFDKQAAKALTTTILPVPTERTKGVVLARTIYGNLLVGPSAEDQDDRIRATVERSALQALIAKAIELVPILAEASITAAYAGLRPASEKKEYRIRNEEERRWITLGAIRSTGLTAALGLASHAADLLRAAGLRPLPVREPVWTPVPNIAEHRERDWQRPWDGKMVCHCERVTEREIMATFESPLPPGDYGGLRRRTRAGMGECQGFYCNARLAELTAGRFAAPLAVGAIG